jgi:hypothetical protein
MKALLFGLIGAVILTFACYQAMELAGICGVARLPSGKLVTPLAKLVPANFTIRNPRNCAAVGFVGC